MFILDQLEGDWFSSAYNIACNDLTDVANPDGDIIFCWTIFYGA